MTERTAKSLAAAFLCAGMALGLAAGGCAPATREAGQRPATAYLTFGPYTSDVSPEAATVYWISSPGVPGSCRLLGEQAGAGVELQAMPVPGREAVRHTARLTGLRPGVRHWYEVTAGGDRLEGSFRTPPEAGDEKPFSFVVVGDTQSYPLRIRSVAEAIARGDPAFVVHTGDLCNNTRDWAQLEAQFFDPWRDLLCRAPVWPARGNHEFGAEPFATLFGLSPAQLWRSFDYGPLHVVLLDQWDLDDSDKMEPQRMAAMAEWLEGDLQAARGRARWILVAGHQQMFNVAGHGSTWGHASILPILYKHGVDLVVSGHSHLYERFVPIGPPGAKPIQFIVSGGGGGPNYASVPSPILLQSVAVANYCVYHVDGDRLTVAVRNSGGSLMDRIVLDRPGGKVSPAFAAAAISPEDAMALLKVYKGLEADVGELRVDGKPLTLSLRTGRFPGGSRVSIATDPASLWTVEATTFEVPTVGPEETPPPAPLVFTPPADVLLGPGQSFSPGPTVAVTLEYHGRTWRTPSVPVGLSEETVRRLMPQAEVVDVARAAEAITVDGDLSEWAAVPLLHLASTGQAGRGIKLAWREDGLFGAITAEQGAIHSDDELPWNADSLEVDLEADGRGRMRMTSRGIPMKFFLWPQAGADSGKAGFRRMGGRVRGGSVRGAWRKTPSGYTMEFRVSSRSLSGIEDALGNADESARRPLEAGRQMGLELILRHDGETVEQFADTRAYGGTWGTPAFWGRIRLTEP